MTVRRSAASARRLNSDDALGLGGGAPMGGFRAAISDAEVVALSDAAYEGGVRYLHLAAFYGYGRNELRMGHCAPGRARFRAVDQDRILHAMKPGEKASRRFPRQWPAGLRAGVRLFLRRHALAGALASQARREDRHRPDPRRRFLDHQGPRDPRRALQDGDGRGFEGIDRSCAALASSARSASASTKPTPACASSRPATSTACCWPAAARRSNRAARRIPARVRETQRVGRPGRATTRHPDRRREARRHPRLRGRAPAPDREGAEDRRVCQRQASN